MSNNVKKTENTEVTVVEEKKLTWKDKIQAVSDKIPTGVKKTVKFIGKVIIGGLTVLGAIDVVASVKEAVGSNNSSNETTEEIDGSIE